MAYKTGWCVYLIYTHSHKKVQI